jgi:hypothetical protein
VKSLVAAGASVNFSREEMAALAYAYAHRNTGLARWLIDKGATIDDLSIFLSDNDSHLTRHSNSEREFVAYLVYSKLVKSGLKLPAMDVNSQATFVRRLKESLISALKEWGPWPKDIAGWSLRFVDVGHSKDDGGNFRVKCDVAVWNRVATFELVSTTGQVQGLPDRFRNHKTPILPRGSTEAVFQAQSSIETWSQKGIS